MYFLEIQEFPKCFKDLSIVLKSLKQIQSSLRTFEPYSLLKKLSYPNIFFELKKRHKKCFFVFILRNIFANFKIIGT